MIEFLMVMSFGLVVLVVGCLLSFMVGYYVGWQEQQGDE